MYSAITKTKVLCVFYLSPRHPDVAKKVQDELDSVFGVGQCPSASDRDRTPYVEAVLHEVQRSANILSLSVVHAAGRDCRLAGYHVPENAQVNFACVFPCTTNNNNNNKQCQFFYGKACAK